MTNNKDNHGKDSNIINSMFEIYDPNFINDIVSATYSLCLNGVSEEDKKQINQEYNQLISSLSSIKINSQNSLNSFDPGIELIRWAQSINESYEKISGDIIKDEDGEILNRDILYDPRSVLKNLSSYISMNDIEVPVFNKLLADLENSDCYNFVSNDLLELDEVAKKERVESIYSALPSEVKDIISEEDVSDVMYLGSSAMFNAFFSYFQHHCLSGSLGDSSILPGVIVSSDDQNDINVDHLYSLIRVCQRTLSKHLLKNTREGEYSVSDKDFWEYSLLELKDTGRIIEDGNFHNSRDKKVVELIHKEMINYVTKLRDTDLSFLKPVDEDGLVPFVSQLDSLNVLMSTKPNGSRDRGIFADEMGTGKTLSAILADATYRNNGEVKRTMVICPNQMKDEWKDRFSKYLSNDFFDEHYSSINDNGDNVSSIKIINGSRSLEGLLDSSVVIVNYEMVCRSLDYKTDGGETVLELSKNALINGLEEMFKDDEVLDSINSSANKIKDEGEGVLRDARKRFRKNEEIIGWINESPELEEQVKRAAYIVSTDDYLREESKKINSLFSYGADFLILDESHAIKNPNSKRTFGIKELAEDIPRLALLTGTLIPNRYQDITVPLKLVDSAYNDNKKIVKDEQLSTFAPKLRKIRQALIPYLSRNKRKNVFPRSYSVTPEDERSSSVAIDNLTKLTYRAIIEDSTLTFSEKTLLTRLTTLNPALAINKVWQMAIRGNSLVDAQSILDDILYNVTNDECDELLGSNYVSPKYKAVAEGIRDNDGNVVVFTSHIQGNTRDLEEPEFETITLIDHLKSEFPNKKILLHDGQTKINGKKNNGKMTDKESWSEREKILDQFDNEEDVVLVASYPTLGEGADLTSANKIICMDLPYILPQQAVGRVDRITQFKDITVEYLIIDDARLSEGTKSGLTIDQAVYNLGADKEKISSIVIDGRSPGEEELLIYNELVKHGNKPHDYTPLRDGLELESERIKRDLKQYIARTKLDSRNTKKNVSEFNELLRRAYINQILFDKSSHTFKSNAMIGQLVAPYLENLSLEKRLLDLGGGPASLALCGGIGRDYDIVDPTSWEDILKIVLEEEKLLFPDNVSFYHTLLPDLKNDTLYDIVTCNNVLHWTSVRSKKDDFSERESLLRSINHKLDDNGLLVLGLPGVYGNLAIENLESLCNNTGFYDLNIGQVSSLQDKGFNELVIIGKKKKEPNNEPLHPSQLKYKHSEGRVSRSIGKKKPRVNKIKKEKKGGDSFSFNGAKIGEVLS